MGPTVFQNREIILLLFSRAQDQASMQLSEMEEEMDQRIQAAERKTREQVGSTLSPQTDVHIQLKCKHNQVPVANVIRYNVQTPESCESLGLAVVFLSTVTAVVETRAHQGTTAHLTILLWLGQLLFFYVFLSLEFVQAKQSAGCVCSALPSCQTNIES